MRLQISQDLLARQTPVGRWPLAVAVAATTSNFKVLPGNFKDLCAAIH